MVLTAAAGTVTGGVVMASYGGHKDPGTFILGLNPSTMILVQNTTSTSTITVTSLSGYTGTIILSASYLTPEITATINPTSITLPANGAAHSTLSVTAPTTQGNYTILVIGASNKNGKTTYSSTMLTVQVVSSQDFTIASSPGSITNPMGSTNTTTITVTSHNGYTGNISLTFTAPFGYFTITGGQNPLRLTVAGTASTTLTITTSSSTALGTYGIMVTGTSGSRSHSTTISVQVVDPNPVIVESLKLNSHTFNNSTSLTLSLANTGNGTITLQSYTIRDSSGNAWTTTSWTGPTIPVNGVGTATILIGPSCPTCIFTGLPGAFLTFLPGQTYTVTVTTARNNPFTYTVAY